MYIWLAHLYITIYIICSWLHYMSKTSMHAENVLQQCVQELEAATHCCNTLLQHTAATHCCNKIWLLFFFVHDYCLKIFNHNWKHLCVPVASRVYVAYIDVNSHSRANRSRSHHVKHVCMPVASRVHVAHMNVMSDSRTNDSRTHASDRTSSMCRYAPFVSMSHIWMSRLIHEPIIH